MGEKESYLLLRGVCLPEMAGSRSGRRTVDLLIRRKDGRGSVVQIVPGNRSDSELLQGIPDPRGPLTLRQGNGAYLLPAFVDSYAAFGHPDYFYREDPASGGAAAAAGGFSDLLLVPQKRVSALGALADLRRRFSGCGCRVHFAAGILPAGGHGSLCDPENLRKEGLNVLTDAGGSPASDEQLYTVMKKAAGADMLLLLPLRCDPGGSGHLHEGRISRLTGCAGIDPVYGLLQLSRILLLARSSGCRVHIPVISSERQLEMVCRAKAEGVRVSCGTTPAYFSMTEDDVIYRGSAAKLDPPLQTAADRRAIVEGLRDGSIDCICSGHTPLSRYEKQGSLTAAAAGAAMLEGVFAATVTELVQPGLISLGRLQELLCEAPARILRLPCGKAAVGEPADFCLVDPAAEWICETTALKGKATNLPFLGMAMRGKILQRIMNGVFDG